MKLYNTARQSPIKNGGDGWAGTEHQQLMPHAATPCLQGAGPGPLLWFFFFFLLHLLDAVVRLDLPPVPGTLPHLLWGLTHPLLALSPRCHGGRGAGGDGAQRPALALSSSGPVLFHGAAASLDPPPAPCALPHPPRLAPCARTGGLTHPLWALSPHSHDGGRWVWSPSSGPGLLLLQPCSPPPDAVARLDPKLDPPPCTLSHPLCPALCAKVWGARPMLLASAPCSVTTLKEQS